MNERVLVETRAFLVVDKPAGVLVIPGRGEAEAPALVAALEAERNERLFVVHRLDRDTSGLLLVARTAAAHRTLSMAFEAGRVQKVYRALCVGEVPEHLDLDVPLAPARRGRMRPARKGEDGKAARTLVRRVGSFRGFSEVEAEPLTGRTHQIRVHLWSAGHPLAVDHQYGRAAPLTLRDLGGDSDEVVLARTPLHASKVVLPALGEGVGPATFEAPLPPDLARVWALLQGAPVNPSP